MRKNTKRLITVAAPVLVAGTLSVVATGTAHADAGSPTCVTRAEYRQVHKGMTKRAVDREFGVHGHRQAGASSGGYRSEVWSYHPCHRFSAVAVSYNANPGGPLRLSAKSAVWSY